MDERIAGDRHGRPGLGRAGTPAEVEDVLDAERSLFTAELQYSQSLGNALQQQVALVKALGGGWVDVADRGAIQPRADAASTPPVFP